MNSYLHGIQAPVKLHHGCKPIAISKLCESNIAVLKTNWFVARENGQLDTKLQV